MAQYNITVDQSTLHELFIGNAQNSGVAKLLESVLNQVLKAEVTEQLAADHYERTEDRQAYRNGSYSRGMKTRVGTIELSVPRIRDEKFSSNLFSRYQRNEQALILTLMEMVVQGVSTRKVSNITEELCGTEFSKSTISELCQNLDPIVNEWNNRPIQDHFFPFIAVDALVLKVREDDRVRARSALLAIGINEAGTREILGIMVGDSETESSWTEFFNRLKARGLKGVDVVTSDCHGGLVNAIKKCFQGVTWQRCQTHFMRNILNATPKSSKSEMYKNVRSILDAPNQNVARILLNAYQDANADKNLKAMDILENGFEDATAVLELPDKYRKKLRTTNGVERLNEEIRRRERVIRIFPNRESVIRLLGAYLMSIDEKWSSDKKYLDMEEYLSWRK